MEQRFPIVTATGPGPGLAGVVIVSPVTGLYLRFVQHEPWAVAGAIVGAVALVFLFAAVWGSRMKGRAIVVSDDGISFPRLASNRPEMIPWTGVEACDRSFDTSRTGPVRYLQLTYYGGRHRKIMELDVSDADALHAAIRDALAKATQQAAAVTSS